MGAVLARQRGVLTRLLLAAAIPPADAESMLLDVILEMDEQGAPADDRELLRRVEAACAAHTERRKRPSRLRRRVPSSAPPDFPSWIVQKRRGKG
jgi:hypothetical protein